MSQIHSEDTHQTLLARIPQVTGRQLPEWFSALEDGPGLVRPEERIAWLAQEHGISHGYARAIVHEHERRRRLNA